MAGRLTVTESQLHELYVQARGYRFANTLLDAENCLRQGDLEQSLKIVTESRAQFARAHERKLREEARRVGSQGKAGQDRRIAKRKEKGEPVLEMFDKAIVGLERMISLREKAAQAPEEDKRPSVTEPGDDNRRAVAPTLPDNFSKQFQSAGTVENELDVLNSFFRRVPVKEAADIAADVLLYIVGQSRNYLACCKTVAVDDRQVALTDAITGNLLKTMPVDRLVELGRRRKLIRLERFSQRESPAVGDDFVSCPQSTSERNVVSRSVKADDADRASTTVILEMGAFTQLLDAAIRCQLVHGTDLIAYVRDREFRMGDYGKAFQLIEGLFGKFTIAVNQRQQRLRREDIDIASGRIVMSPKELQAKRARDSAQNQLIDRCRSRFMRVMEGLRVLISQETLREEIENGS